MFPLMLTVPHTDCSTPYYNPHYKDCSYKGEQP